MASSPVWNTSIPSSKNCGASSKSATETTSRSYSSWSSARTVPSSGSEASAYTTVEKPCASAGVVDNAVGSPMASMPNANATRRR